MGLSIERRIKQVLPNKLKYFILRRTAFSLGLLTKVFGINQTITGKPFPFGSAKLSYYDKGRIFLETWESAEIKFTRKVLKQGMYHVIELGSSIGVNYAYNRSLAQSWLCVEPIPKNISTLKQVQDWLKHNDPIIEAAIDYSSKKFVQMLETRHESSKVIHNDQTGINTMNVKSMRFSEIVNSVALNEPYVLVTDIEGGEAPIFFNDKGSLENCIAIVAELDNTTEHSIVDQEIQIQKLGFKKIEQYGSNVFIFMR